MFSLDFEFVFNSASLLFINAYHCYVTVCIFFKEHKIQLVIKYVYRSLQKSLKQGLINITLALCIWNVQRRMITFNVLSKALEPVLQSKTRVIDSSILITL